ncbi:hypothetical protein [Prauserella rugosa]|uniref:AAA+ ATPase domain-containing protein n=1 Tax=Prauserella rugosa TaxID=43354 RepID=A0A660C8M5_9PSEU|nr:hypothetical protein [Prauserella rugosa]KMS83079.1 hypothetical protein ACZ91_55075 [Streptomyces regensis]TWH19898.1 hypothetical protein JD82_01735 [Prauserella rugosa]
MQMIADRVGVGGPHGTLVPQTSLTVASGELALVAGDPGAGVTAFGLALAGRLRPSTGTVTIAESDSDSDSGAGADDADDADAEADSDSTADSTADSTDSTADSTADSDAEAEAEAEADEPNGSTRTTRLTAPAELRRCSAVVDSPGVSEPDEALPVRVVVGEELALAGAPASKADVARWLAEHDAAAFAGSRFEHLDAGLRIRLLTALAASRPGVELVVLDRPDRHTSNVDAWLDVARAHAERGLAVVVLTATAPDSALPATPARLGRLSQPDPMRCLREDHS